MNFQIFKLEKTGQKYNLKAFETDDNPLINTISDDNSSNENTNLDTVSSLQITSNDHAKIDKTIPNSKAKNNLKINKLRPTMSLNKFLNLNLSKNMFTNDFYSYLKHLDKNSKQKLNQFLLTNKKTSLDKNLMIKLKTSSKYFNKKQKMLLSNQAKKVINI